MSGIRVLTRSFWRLDVWDQGPDVVVRRPSSWFTGLPSPCSPMIEAAEQLCGALL